MQPGTYNIIIHDRTTLTVVFLLKDENNAVFDLTGYTVKAVANGDVATLPGGILDLEPSITNAVAGEITINKTVAQTDPLIPSNAPLPKWDMLIVHTASGVTTKILQGTLTILETQTP